MKPVGTCRASTPTWVAAKQLVGDGMIVKTKSAANDDGIGMSLLSHALDRQAVGLGEC